MLQNSSEFNSIGPGGYGGFGGGFGGIAPFGLFGLLGLGNRGGLGGNDGYGDGCAREAAVLAAIGNAKDTTVAEGRNLADNICDVKGNVKDAAYAAAIQAERNTAQLSAQAQAIAALTEKRLDDLSSAGAAQTAAIIARINQSEVDSLRDQLLLERRRVDARELEINITNSNTSLQNQIQAQAQIQSQRDFDHSRRYDALFSQTAKAGQDIINVGGLMAGIAQTANPTNVNSKS